jgi:hypothetical protein
VSTDAKSNPTRDRARNEIVAVGLFCLLLVIGGWAVTASSAGPWPFASGAHGSGGSAVAQVPSSFLQWTELTVPTAPSPRAGEGMAYDPSLNSIIMFGGCTSGFYSNLSCVPTNETWLYHDGAWSQVHPTTSPPARVSPLLTYDAADGYLLLFGGASGNATRQCFNDTWEFTGSNWVQIRTTTAPVGCDIEGAYDPADGYVVLLDSNGTYSVEPQTNATWKYLSGEWTLLSVGTGPSPMAQAAIDFEGTLNTTVLYGGWYCVTPSGPCNSFNVTWLYRAGVWSSTQSPGSPSNRNGEMFAYDPVLDASVLFGGRLASTWYNDTWEYSDGAWSDLTALTTAPPPRSGAGLVYYPPDHALLLFGGYSPGYTSSGYENDVWEFAVPPVPVVNSFGETSQSVTVGAGVELVAGVTSRAGPVSYVYTGLPPGCSSLNASVLLCFPTSAGNYTVTVTVTDPYGQTASASVLLKVVAAASPSPGPTGPQGPSGSPGPSGASTPLSAYLEGLIWGAFALAILAVLLGLVAVLRKPPRAAP